MVLMLVSLYLSRTLMAQWFDPRHEQLVMSKKLIQLRLKLDSLENQVELKDQYMSNVQKILRGDVSGSHIDSSNQETKIRDVSTEEIEPIPAIDSQFRKDFEQSDLSYISISNRYLRELEETFFFSPIEGIVSRPFDVSIGHYGVDVVSKSEEPVKSIADGTVIFADWTQDAGNVIAIQHRGNIISVYKHNSALLKKVGNFVYSGEVISIIGNTGELTTGPHLHFEIWYNGNPVNPEDFISF